MAWGVLLDAVRTERGFSVLRRGVAEGLAGLEGLVAADLVFFVDHHVGSGLGQLTGVDVLAGTGDDRRRRRQRADVLDDQPRSALLFDAWRPPSYHPSNRSECGAALPKALTPTKVEAR